MEKNVIFTQWNKAWDFIQIVNGSKFRALKNKKPLHNVQRLELADKA